MTKKTLIIATIAGAALLFNGCASTSGAQYVGANTPQAQPVTTMGIDRQDFEKAAEEAISSLLQSGALNKNDGGRYVVSIGRILNDTTQRIDTDMLIKKIRIAMLQSGKAVISTAVSAGGAEDSMIYETRKLRENEEFKQNTVAKKGTIYAPDFSLSGKIIQRSAKATNNKQLVEYYFQLTLSHIESGLAFWEGESVIGKMGSNDTVSW